jgi:L-threonylcarbamoyladenylate synthase
MNWNNQNLIKILKQNGVVVMPTDTIYGIVGKAGNPSVVNRIYKIKKRASNKPCIILIGSVSELKKFSVHLSLKQKKLVKKYWPFDSAQDKPGAVSIVFDCSVKRLQYLHRGTKTLAFRLPAPASLQKLLKKTGPLIAPSSNPEGLSPARSIPEARKYFGNSVDLYKDGPIFTKRPSKIIKIGKDNRVVILRA